MVSAKLPKDYDWWEVPREPLPSSGPEWMAVQFERTGNGLYALQAFVECCDSGSALPASVLAHLRGAFLEVLQLAKRPPKQHLGPLAEILLGARQQTNGRGSRLSEYGLAERNQQIADAVDEARYLQYPPRTVREIVEEIASRFGVSEKVVNDARRCVRGLAVEPVRPVRSGS